MQKAFARTISVGMPQDVDFGGHVFRSAILKKPVSGLVTVTRTGIEGNKPAVHPDAIYAFSAESYDYWADKLGANANEWSDGYVGENLTLVGLDERTLALGDIIRIGQKVVLQVLGPRVPCFKLAWRLGQSNAFLQDFALSGHCGYYLQVLEEGRIEAGDPVEVIELATDRIVLSRVSELTHGAGEVVEADLKHVLASPCLSETSALLLRSKLVKLQEKRLTGRGRWKGWRPFIVKALENETPEICSFYLTPQDGGEVAGYLAGQFLTLRLAVHNGEEIIRTYTVSDYGREDNLYRISVKREVQGQVSTAMHQTISPGSVIDIKAPAGVFTLDRTRLEPVVLISAGIGITPLLSMAKAHALRGEEAPSMYFIHCAKRKELQAFRGEIDKICATSEKFRQYFVIKTPSADDERGVDYHYDGRLDLKHLEQVLGETYVEYCGTHITIPYVQSLFYICGPEKFQQTLVQELEAAGSPPENIRTESFVTTKGGAIGNLVETSEVVLSRAGKSITWSAEDGLTLLELLEKHGVDADFGCRNGICHACKCGINLGVVHYDSSPNPMPEEGAVLMCCAKPGSAELHLDI